MIPSMAGLGAAICYNMLGIRMYVVQTKQFRQGLDKENKGTA